MTDTWALGSPAWARRAQLLLLVLLLAACAVVAHSYVGTGAVVGLGALVAAVPILAFGLVRALVEVDVEARRRRGGGRAKHGSDIHHVEALVALGRGLRWFEVAAALALVVGFWAAGLTADTSTPPPVVGDAPCVRVIDPEGYARCVAPGDLERQRSRRERVGGSVVAVLATLEVVAAHAAVRRSRFADLPPPPPAWTPPTS